VAAGLSDSGAFLLIPASPRRARFRQGCGRPPFPSAALFDHPNIDHQPKKNGKPHHEKNYRPGAHVPKLIKIIHPGFTLPRFKQKQNRFPVWVGGYATIHNRRKTRQRRASAEWELRSKSLAGLSQVGAVGFTPPQRSLDGRAERIRILLQRLGRARDGSEGIRGWVVRRVAQPPFCRSAAFLFPRGHFPASST